MLAIVWFFIGNVAAAGSWTDCREYCRWDLDAVRDSKSDVVCGCESARFDLKRAAQGPGGIQRTTAATTSTSSAADSTTSAGSETSSDSASGAVSTTLSDSDLTTALSVPPTTNAGSEPTTTDPAVSAPSSTADTSPAGLAKHGLSKGAQAGIGVGVGLGGAGIIIALAALCLARRRRKSQAMSSAKYAPQAQSELSVIEAPQSMAKSAPTAIAIPFPPSRGRAEYAAPRASNHRHSGYYEPADTQPYEELHPPPDLPRPRSQRQLPETRPLSIPPPHVGDRTPLHSGPPSPTRSISPVSPISPISPISPTSSRGPSMQRDRV